MTDQHIPSRAGDGGYRLDRRPGGPRATHAGFWVGLRLPRHGQIWAPLLDLALNDEACGLFLVSRRRNRRISAVEAPVFLRPGRSGQDDHVLRRLAGNAVSVGCLMSIGASPLP